MKLKKLIKSLLILYLKDFEESEITVYEHKTEQEFAIKDFMIMPNNDIVVLVEKEERKVEEK